MTDRYLHPLTRVGPVRSGSLRLVEDARYTSPMAFDGTKANEYLLKPYPRPEPRKALVEFTPNQVLQRRSLPHLGPSGTQTDPADPPPPNGTPIGLPPGDPQY